MPKRLRLSLKRDEALRANKVVVGKDKLVYVLIADKRLKFPNGKSRIAYIGTTRKGMARIAQSAAGRAEAMFALHGVRSFHARFITCQPRQNVRTWMKLERAMLLCFKEKFGEIPKCNSQGNKMKTTDEFKYFSQSAVKNIVDDLS
jgi:hypothetical protein